MRARPIAAVILAVAVPAGAAAAAAPTHPLHVTRTRDALRLCGPRPRAPGRYRCVGKPDRYELERIKYVYEKIAATDVKGHKSASDDWLAP